MVFRSILSLYPTAATEESSHPPAFFRDLHLDQVVEVIAASCKDYDIRPFFHQRLVDRESIIYRQEVLRDLEHAPVRDAIADFCGHMRAMREQLARTQKLYYPLEQQRWFLGAVERYCRGVDQLKRELTALDLTSRGLCAFRDYVIAYEASDAFRTLMSETAAITNALAAIRYCVLIRGNSVTVRHFHDELDYTIAVEGTFEKFRRQPVKDYRVGLSNTVGLNHVEAQILERVAWLHPEPFAALAAYCSAHADYVDQTLARFDHEVQFYVSYLAFIDTLRRRGLSFCYPGVSDTSKAISGHDVFDVALAHVLTDKRMPVVTNDFFLRGDERIFVVSGPNQGGKTTFARTVGQLHYLAALGCPVPGTSARLFLFDRLFCHFEREEAITSLRGKLQDDLVRIHDILRDATPNSLIIMNEIFSSTTVQDALFLSRQIFAGLSHLDALAVCVTFLSELASFDGKTVSIVSTIDPRDPAVRTFKLTRRPADGLAYAQAIARKYGLTYDVLKERIPA